MITWKKISNFFLVKHQLISYSTETERNDQKKFIYTLLRIISGARYSGVPHRVHVRPFTFFANPKSVICKIYVKSKRSYIEKGDVDLCYFKSIKKVSNTDIIQKTIKKVQEKIIQNQNINKTEVT